MNPARSGARTTVLPSVPAANSVARATVSSDVSSDGTNSTRAITGTGLKKWSPTTASGRLVCIASFMIGIDDVFEASTASPATTISSRARKTSALRASSSTTASTTSSRSASSARSVVKRSLASASSRSVSVNRPRSAPLASEAATRPCAFSASSGDASRTITSTPDRAATSAMPPPI